MSEAPHPLFLRRFKTGAERRETAVCALLFEPTEGLTVATARLAWSSLMGSRLRELARAALDTAGRKASRCPTPLCGL